MKTLIVILLTSAAALAHLQAAGLTNPNFNTGDISGWWQYAPEPANEAVYVLNNTAFSFDSTPYAYLSNRTDQSSIRLGQEADITGGAKFNVSLKYRATNWGGGGVEIWYYDSNWARVGELYEWQNIYSGSGADTQWGSFTSPTWTAPAQAAHASVRLHGWGWSDMYVDSVQLTTVPEPTVLAFFALGASAMLLRRRGM